MRGLVCTYLFHDFTPTLIVICLTELFTLIGEQVLVPFINQCFHKWFDAGMYWNNTALSGSGLDSTFKVIPAASPEIPVDTGRPVAFVRVTEVGVPRIGVTRVGEVPNTRAPEPVSSVTRVESSEDVSISVETMTEESRYVGEIAVPCHTPVPIVPSVVMED